MINHRDPYNRDYNTLWAHIIALGFLILAVLSVLV